MADILEALSSFNPEERRFAREKLAAETTFPQEKPWVNMHLHTFFSYNGEGWSPSRIAYEMKKLGLFSAAICDFDVLQGLEEFVEATDLFGLRAAVALESRVFFSEYANCDINSPGENGVDYFMGMGFVKQPAKGTEAEKVLAGMLAGSHARNRAVIDRINAKISEFQLDYDKDVLPLTPNGNATERHIIAAFNALAVKVCGSNENAAKTWAKIFGSDVEETVAKAQNYNGFNEFLRGKLIKRGGIGYSKPTKDTFPPIEKVIRFILDCRAIPMCAWLDGDSEGEKDPVAMLECLAAKGVQAVNIIPDRNWNFKDADVKARKTAALAAFVKASEDLDMPINVGTEANKPGQRLVDGFDSPELAPYLDTFHKGAAIMVGHTRLLRFADLSLTDAKCADMFSSKKVRNDFFAKVGALPCPTQAIRNALQDMGPEKALSAISVAAVEGKWI